MHMADALLSPVVGGTMWAATAVTFAYCSRKINNGLDDIKVPLMGVLGAFIFAVQMINFTIPGTGASGHLGGGLLLAVLLGPHAAFLTIAAVLTVQALFFADGGLLALGCNIFNLGFFPCFIAYNFIFRILVRNEHLSNKASGIGSRRLVLGSTIAAVAGLQLGAFGVVLQTTLSGVTSLSFSSFVLLVQPIHLAIGIVEGLATAGMVTYIWKARPEILERSSTQTLDKVTSRKIIAAFAAASIFIGGFVSWYASNKPDGLEWALGKVSGSQEKVLPKKKVHASLANLREKTSIMPDYAFRTESSPVNNDSFNTGWGNPSVERSVAGLIGGALTLFMTALLGLALKSRKVKAKRI